MKRVFSNLEATSLFAHQLGSQLRGGECIELAGDVGAGKTTLTKNIVAGAGSEDWVSSPSFTISNIYKSPKFNIYHFDFYRLHEPGLIEHELHDALQDGNAVIIIEWSNIVKHVLPSTRIVCKISAAPSEARTIQLTIPSTWYYIKVAN